MIRLAENSVGDQKRVATPQHARSAGANFVVVGRPIIESKKPDRLAEVQGRKVLDKYNCIGCHMERLAAGQKSGPPAAARDHSV